MDLRLKSVSGHFLRDFLKAAERHGLDPTQVRDLMDVTEAELSQADARVPGDKHLKMLELARNSNLKVHESEGDSLSWVERFPDLASVVLNDSTLREALRDFVFHRDFVGNVDYLLLNETGTSIAFDYVLDGGTRSAECALGNFAMIVSIAKLYDENIEVRDVAIAAEHTDGLASMCDVIGTHVRVRQPMNRLVLQSRMFDKRFDIFNPTLARVQRPIAREKLTKIRDSNKFVHVVERCVRESLVARTNDFAAQGLQEDVCERLGVTRSALQRRLAIEGTTFTDVLASTRAAEARRLLEHTSMPIREISECVGYKSTIAFTNFFSQSQGISPARYRDQHRRWDAK